ncbi:oxidoreductase [Skermanella stibiiresistens SB22]|uniref:Oxidoreductase n=1 Tax=Skermanella stibiiresistens SB22 TaxID=1385369 RepID=W9H8X6_9PROT|nr:Gfo/Idh/MocA family oxidoreductase [Skermanella stibiiresistens]EWY41176.1 oxidoreductase [Skermanella stibiiresistens SB22]
MNQVSPAKAEPKKIWPKKIWNVAVVGAGLGRAHIETGYEVHRDKFRVLALCDPDEGLLREVGDSFDIPRRVASLEEALAMADVDIVDISAPLDSRAGCIIAALEAGKHVVCEMPFAGPLAGTDRVIAAEAMSKGWVMPILPHRFGDGVQRAKRIIDSGIAGKPWLATVETFWKPAPTEKTTPRRGQTTTEPAGVLVSHALHNHDLLTFLMGDVETVHAQTRARANQIGVDDCVVAALVMRSGALASCSATPTPHDEYGRLRLTFENVVFEFESRPDQPGKARWTVTPASSEIESWINAELADWTPIHPGFDGQLKPFHEALTTGGPMPATLDDARRSGELIAAIQRSAETNAAAYLNRLQ